MASLWNGWVFIPQLLVCLSSLKSALSAGEFSERNRFLFSLWTVAWSEEAEPNQSIRDKKNTSF